MMTRIFWMATAAAMVASAVAAQPYGYTGGYLPAPAYAYAGQGSGDDEQAQDEGRCDSFTLLGAHGGVTVLGLDAGVGGHLGVGGGGCGHHHHRRHIGFVPPAEPAPAPTYAPPPQQYAPPPPPCCAPPPPPPCGCEPGGW